MQAIKSSRFWLSLLSVLVLFASHLQAQVVAYHGVSSASHQSQFTSLTGQGYRLVSLSVAGGLSAPSYSAVWEQVGGPGWVASHDMSTTLYATTRATWIGQGYRAKLITTAGTGSNRVIAAVFVNDGASVYDSSTLAASSLSGTIITQRGLDRIPCSIDTYEDTIGNVYYCVVFEPNPTGIVWGHDIDASAADFTTTRVAHDEGGERLACLGMSDTQRYVSVWYDQRVGTENLAHNQSGTGWQTQFNIQTANGLHPRLIASGGAGTAQRFSGSFAQYRLPQVRQWQVTGTYRPEFVAFDNYMQNLMLNHDRRAGAMAIAKDGKLVYARAFTWAESGYPITQPTHAFRIGSCTKPITAIAAHEADEQAFVSMTTTPAVALGLSYPAGSSFPNVNLRDILEYTSGIQEGYSPESVANWLNPSSPQYPVSMAQGSTWLAMRPMLYNPNSLPTLSQYSNAAYMLAGEILRVRTGQSFMGFVQSDVLGPLGITRIRVAPSEYGQLTANDVRHHLNELVLVPSQLHTDRRRRSAQYAEDLDFKRGSGGMTSSVVDYVRLLAGVFDLRGADTIVLDPGTVTDALDRHTYPKWENQNETSDVCLAGMAWQPRPGGVFSYSKGGSLTTNAVSDVCWRTDGISWAVFLNTNATSASTDTVNNMIEAVASWPNVDEFPNYGLPAFPQRPLIESVLPSTLSNMTTTGHFNVTGKRLDTVTSVNVGGVTITSTSPTTWHDGYFVVTSPTAMDVYPPPGRAPTNYQLSVTNGVGTSSSVTVSFFLASSFRTGAPANVLANQPWAAWVSRGTNSGLSLQGTFVILCLSFSNQPSTAPGIVDLGLGNQFSDLIMTGAETFGLFNSCVRFDLPALPSGSIWLEAVALDLLAPSAFPLPTTNTVQVTRQ